MNKIPITKLEIDLFHKKLDNGLEIFIVPKSNCNNIFVTCTFKFGAVDREFNIDDKKNKVPAGIAHFLEHKIFEQEDGVDPFRLFNQNGTNANAYTNYDQTTYLFSGPDKLEENIKILFDYLGNPYFTDENVEREKGIIIQELTMYKDVPIRISMEEMYKNVFFKHHIRDSVAGTTRSIKKTTKEDLYTCYNNFYVPNNMFIVVTGNVKPDEVTKIIEKNMNFKNNNSNVELIKKDEPDRVKVKEKHINMSITIPLVNYGIKINYEKLGFDKKIIRQYLSIFLDSNFGSTSDFSIRLKDKEILDENIDYSVSVTDKHLLINFIGETYKEKELIDEIKETLLEKNDLKTFERKKKVFISSIIYSSDNIFSINNMITSSIINHNGFNPDLYNQINSLNYEDYNKLLENIDFSNDTILVIESK